MFVSKVNQAMIKKSKNEKRKTEINWEMKQKWWQSEKWNKNDDKVRNEIKMVIKWEWSKSDDKVRMKQNWW